MKKNEFVTFRTDQETKRKLEEIAKREDRTLSYIINQIIKIYVQEVKTNEQT